MFRQSRTAKKPSSDQARSSGEPGCFIVLSIRDISYEIFTTDLAQHRWVKKTEYSRASQPMRTEAGDNRTLWVWNISQKVWCLKCRHAAITRECGCSRETFNRSTNTGRQVIYVVGDQIVRLPPPHFDRRFDPSTHIQHCADSRGQPHYPRQRLRSRRRLLHRS